MTTGGSARPKDHTAVAINCLRCKKRNKCTKLCPQARRYANQDMVEPREKTFSQMDYTADEIDEQKNPFTAINLSTKLWVIKLFFRNHLSQSQIADMLYVSRQYVSRTVRQYRPKIRQIRRERFHIIRGFKNSFSTATYSQRGRDSASRRRANGNT